MGSSMYSVEDRSIRAEKLNYATASMDSLFTQQSKRVVHEDMKSQNIDFREARDSELHPNSYPVQFWLDVTGSMGSIPETLIRNGLPTMMSTIIQKGTSDVALMFGGIGDHEFDQYPLQVGQFESGDAELDMWLTRTYLEKGGGANAGESYPLAWYFAANHTATDAWDKRGEKGVLITCGDEPFLNVIPQNALKSIMASTCRVQGSVTATDLYNEAQKRWHVYHIFLEHNGRTMNNAWLELLGQRVIKTSDPSTVPEIVANIVLQHSLQKIVYETQDTSEANNSTDDENIIFIK